MLGGAEISEKRAFGRNLLTMVPLFAVAIGSPSGEISVWQAGGVLLLYAIGFASSARDGVGLVGWLTGTRIVAIHQPFGDEVRADMSYYEVLRGALGRKELRDFEGGDEDEWRAFQESVRTYR